MKKYVFFLVLILIFRIGIVQAQVTYIQTMTSNGFYGKGAYTSNSTTYLHGDKMTSESEFKFTGKMMKYFNSKGQNVEITRLDKELFWQYNTDKKKYKELTFAEMKKMVEEGTNQAQWPAAGEEPTDSEDSEYEWQEPTVKVTETGETANINGYNCKQYIMTVETIGTHKATAVKDTLLFTNETWNSTALEKMEQVPTFNKVLAEKLGFSHETNMGIARLMSMYGDQFEMLSEEMKKVEGYPVKSDISLTQTTNFKQLAKNEEAQSEESKSSADITNPGKMFGSFLGKKAKSMVKKEEEKPQGFVEIFQATTEITDVSFNSIDPAKFEVPAKYKLDK